MLRNPARTSTCCAGASANTIKGLYGGYTSTRRPVAVVWAEHFLNITDAIAVERQIKGWSRAKKEALIRGDYDLIKALARRRT
jgi:putative endonuclease